MRAVFKADGGETRGWYSVSEWWLEPHSRGPGAHVHADNDELFYVIEGRPGFLVGAEWHETARGSFLLIPAGTMHDFRNPADERAGFLSIYIPGGFERSMPGIVKWFAEHDLA
jgi:mannose-6-phosphate isomerase-like protein (cupin superfamily)